MGLGVPKWGWGSPNGIRDPPESGWGSPNGGGGPQEEWFWGSLSEFRGPKLGLGSPNRVGGPQMGMEEGSPNISVGLGVPQ